MHWASVLCTLCATECSSLCGCTINIVPIVHYAMYTVFFVNRFLFEIHILTGFIFFMDKICFQCCMYSVLGKLGPGKLGPALFGAQFAIFWQIGPRQIGPLGGKLGPGKSGPGRLGPLAANWAPEI